MSSMRKEIPNFYVLEGLDGVGKSTIINELRLKGYLVFKTPTENLHKARQIFDKQDIRIRFLYYLLGVIDAGSQVSNSDPHERKICDRFLLTTVAAHEAMGVPRSFISTLMPILDSIPRPEHTFLLTASEDVRRQRLGIRGVNQTDLRNFEINKDILLGYQSWSKELGHVIFEVDTSFLDPTGVVNEIEEIISLNKT